MRNKRSIISFSLLVSGVASCSPLNNAELPNTVPQTSEVIQSTDRAFNIQSLSTLPSDEDLSDPTMTEFLVNTITSAQQISPVIAMDKEGENFVIAWNSNHEPDARYNLYARRFTVDHANETVDDSLDSVEFKLNNDAGARNYTNPTIAMKPNGGHFVAAWEDNLGSAIQVKAFDFSTAAPIGTQLNASGTTLLYRSPDITFNDNYFSVVWAQSRSVFTTPYDYDIYGRIGSVTTTPFPNFAFSAAAARIHADDTTMFWTFEQTRPVVTTRNASGGSNSDFTGAWVKSSSILDYILGFSSVLSPTTLASNVQLPDIDSPPGSSEHAIAWTNTTTQNIMAARYDGVSTTYASSAINTSSGGNRESVHVAMNDDYMLFVWRGEDGDAGGIYGRMYDISSGTFGAAKSTDEFLINDVTTDEQGSPAVAMDKYGNFVVAWSDYSSGVSRIKAKRITIGAINALP